jgi:hypothetical protein
MNTLDLHISERLRKLLPPLTTEEKKGLKENILSDGKVLDKLLYWHDGERNVVIDGMNRWELVRGTDTPYETQQLQFKGYEEAEIWILDHQLGRRNLLNPSDIRKVRGELYNRIKRQDKGHGDQVAGRQNVGPVASAAQKVAEKSGVSARTVERDGARIDAVAKLTKSAQLIADKATDAEVKVLEKLDSGAQELVARAVRTGQAKTVKEALKLTGVKPPEPETSHGKPLKKNSRAFWYKQWTHSIGPLCRLVDKIANDVNEKHGQRHKSVKDNLEAATQEMIDWMGVQR